MSAAVTLQDGNLLVTISGLQEVLTLHHEISVPLDHIQTAALAAQVPGDVPHWYAKIAGTGTLHYLGGIFRHDGGTTFCDCDTSRPQDTLVLMLTDEPYAEIVLTLPDAAATLEQVRAAIAEPTA